MVFGRRVDQFPDFLDWLICRAEGNANDRNVWIERHNVDRRSGDGLALSVDDFVTQAEADSGIKGLIGETIKTSELISGRKRVTIGGRISGGRRYSRCIQHTAGPEKDACAG